LSDNFVQHSVEDDLSRVISMQINFHDELALRFFGAVQLFALRVPSSADQVI
jgi:hypothetical protein